MNLPTMLPHHRRVERREGDSGVEAVPELRAEELLVASTLGLSPVGAAAPPKPDRPALQIAHADVARHQQDDVPEVGGLAVVVGQRPWSITCSRMLKICGWAFSISSRRSTACGVFAIASVRRPPWSNPT